MLTHIVSLRAYIGPFPKWYHASIDSVDVIARMVLFLSDGSFKLLRLTYATKTYYISYRHLQNYNRLQVIKNLF